MAKYVYKIEGADLTPQEEYVLDQVQAGELADLKARFGEAEENRRLRARFLEELLTGGLEGFKVHRRGLGIAHGVVAEAMDLQNAEIAHIVSLFDCLFQEQANIRDSRFQRHLILNNSKFQKKVDFHRLEVKLGLLCRGTIFQGEANFSHTRIGGQFNAEGAQFQGQGPDNEANFNGMMVGQIASLSEAVFQGPVDFGGADIGRQFSASGAKFQGQGPDNKANFNGMIVGQSAFFDKAVFLGQVDFGNTDIGRQFNAQGAQFQGQGPDNKAIFSAMKVVMDAFFREAVFQGPVDFGGADISGQFNAQRAQFQGQGPYNKADFNGMKVREDAFFDNAVFHVPVDFINSDIGGQFSAEGAHFQGQGADNQANFNAMKVGQDVFLREAVFQGPVDFVGADIGGQFDAREAKFVNENGPALFAGLKVGDIAFFDRALFKDGLTLAGARLLELMLRDLKAPVAEMSLERAVVGRELSIKNVTVGKLLARNMEVKVNAALEQVTIQEKADLQDSSFQALHLHEVSWPASKDNVLVEGLTYKAIYAGDEPKDWEKLLAWVEGSRFNTQNYTELEAYFNRCGHRDRADRVYIAGKYREVKKSLKELKVMPWWHPGRWLLWLTHWLTWFFWGLLAGYGRKPGRVVWVSLAIICLGALVYNLGQFSDVQKKLGFAGDGVLPTIGLRLFLSCYILLSALPGWSTLLPLDSPAYGSFTFFCFWFQRFCGWLLVSVGLAALYTRLK